MRTTVTLDDDVVPLVKQYAESRSVGFGKAVSDLVRRGANAPLATRVVNGFHVVDLAADSPKVTTEHVLALENDDL